ncbi:MAG: cytochrome c oxidase subunit 3 family protein [Acidobacteriota bacterium]|nr:cytochrome c oxidase subunit 3 family protein [Acidobacteriota bacterium]
MADAHPAGLAHHFESFEQQREASFFGMWVFLITEIMFFGGLFAAYVVYRSAHEEAFVLGSSLLDIRWGAFNTVVLIGSSLTMALSVWAARTSKRKLLVVFLLLTVLLGSIFLGVKAIEYSHKFHEHLVPGPSFAMDHFPADEAPYVQMFFNLYFMMTGLHALHMVIGIGLLLSLVVMAARGAFTPENHNLVEGVGLYWHFVDIVWIFLFPLLYLLGRSA